MTAFDGCDQQFERLRQFPSLQSAAEKVGLRVLRRSLSSMSLADLATAFSVARRVDDIVLFQDVSITAAAMFVVGVMQQHCDRPHTPPTPPPAPDPPPTPAPDPPPASLIRFSRQRETSWPLSCMRVDRGTVCGSPAKCRYPLPSGGYAYRCLDHPFIGARRLTITESMIAPTGYWAFGCAWPGCNEIATWRCLRRSAAVYRCDSHSTFQPPRDSYFRP